MSQSRGAQIVSSTDAHRSRARQHRARRPDSHCGRVDAGDVVKTPLPSALARRSRPLVEPLTVPHQLAPGEPARTRARPGSVPAEAEIEDTPVAAPRGSKPVAPAWASSSAASVPSGTTSSGPSSRTTSRVGPRAMRAQRARIRSTVTLVLGIATVSAASCQTNDSGTRFARPPSPAEATQTSTSVSSFLQRVGLSLRARARGRSAAVTARGETAGTRRWSGSACRRSRGWSSARRRRCSRTARADSDP